MAPVFLVLEQPLKDSLGFVPKQRVLLLYSHFESHLALRTLGFVVYPMKLYRRRHYSNNIVQNLGRNARSILLEEVVSRFLLEQFQLRASMHSVVQHLTLD